MAFALAQCPPAGLSNLGVSRQGATESALQQLAELIGRQSRVANDTTHGEGVHRVVSRDRDDPGTVRHDPVPTLPYDFKARLRRALIASRWLTPGILPTPNSRG